MQNIGGIAHVKLSDGTVVPVVAIVGTGGEIEVTGPNVQKMIPAPNGYAITPDNDADLPDNVRALYVGSAGDIKVDFVDSGSGVVIKNTTAGSILPVQIKRVYATGTTATNLVGLF